MDVSRIGAVSTRQIDWRKLTSKEIIKYDEQGVDVPDIYLQWAKAFIADVSSTDKDETTYEMANSATLTTDTTETSSTVDEEEPTDTSGETAESEEVSEQDQTKTEAQAQRESLQQDGVSLLKQARIFTKESKASSKELTQSILSILTAESASNNEIAKLESYMKEILNEAERVQNELKTEVAKINDDKNDSNSFAKINKLEKQLERYGNTAQAQAASSEMDFSGYDATINGQLNAILHAADYGSETADIGNEVITAYKGDILVALLIGYRAVSVGNKTLEKAQTTEDIKNEALGVNNENLGKIAGYKTEIENKTGVAGVETSNNTDNQTSEQTKDEGEKTAENNQTETDKVAAGSIDEILQTKIRRGENIENNA